MIAHMSYVMCDACGAPAEMADNADEARAIARRQGFIRDEHRRDLCRGCAASRDSDRGSKSTP